MTTPLRVMILEDRTPDQTLIKRQVNKYRQDCLFLVAKDKETYTQKLDWFLPDLILADFNLPGYTGLEALIYAKEHKPFIPFVFVTGGLKPENHLSEIILKSADGFVNKDKLNTLSVVLENVMESSQAQLLRRKEQVEAEHQKQITILKITELINLEEHFSKKAETISLLSSLIPSGNLTP